MMILVHDTRTMTTKVYATTVMIHKYIRIVDYFSQGLTTIGRQIDSQSCNEGALYGLTFIIVRESPGSSPLKSALKGDS